ncbi:MAG: hybrid sensor histidine kinase/response regulator [Bacteroidetes bacterium]|nr:hybrid sensor histidine kinase/response regulator [Bacteroidota bacterium]MBU1114407.1 hybrid sensor histidine kinase/response regulator [Bacteroidota bacterium]MBU1797208.1 hybrid sensor histidine kinase/response regulator [Bacteroidota bacterium]
MDKKEEAFLKQLQATFKVEAEEHINILSSGLIELEKNPKDKNSFKLIETIFREAHSLKGAARSVSRNDIESICQVLESIFSKLKNELISFTAEHFDILHKAIDTISKMVSGTATKNKNDNMDLIKQLQSITMEEQVIKIHEKQTESLKKTFKTVEPAVEETISSRVEAEASLSSHNESAHDNTVKELLPQMDTVRIQTAKLDPLFLQAEQMIQSKIAAVQRTVELKNIYDFVGSWKAELRKLENRHSINSTLQLKEIINWTNEKLEETEKNIFILKRSIENDARSLGRMIDDQLESMKNVLMLPISTIIEVFPRLVRDIARSQGKEVELIIHGKEIEVDKRILEELKDPLIHLVRNCIDHGINKPEERLKINKPAHGTISLIFTVLDGRNLEISISDDGAGINIDKIISLAVKTGVISKDNIENLTTQESYELIYKSGITTSPIITDISGRGLGLAIVREKVEKLGGKVSVESQPNIGTTFRLFLPLTLSTFRGVLVKTGEHFFFVPTVNVERVLRINSAEIKTVENRETILIDKEVMGIVKLSEVLGLNSNNFALSSKNGNTTPSSNFIQIIIITLGNKRICFKVDEIFDEHQILVKELGRQLLRVRNISGTTVLGSGKVVPVLNISDLMKSAVNSISSSRIIENVKQPEIKYYKVLVIDDSITARTLIKNILETAGYDVVTAVDGVDAYTKALVGEFDLIVSDVDMPRMNGFELTAKIRKDKRLSELPVVLVTALESSDDREHGIDVGANAYIVKSSFDQSNLLEVIKKLL